MLFSNRVDAGRQLAVRLQRFRGDDVVVLGLPRGGVPVAYEVARELKAPLDVIVVRKLGVPQQPELGLGAIGEDGVRIINPDVVRLADVTDSEINKIETRERVELNRRARRFRGSHPRVSLEGRTALIIDDGIATGSTARAACQVARAHGAARVVLAVPVAPADWTNRLADDADELICLHTPANFFAVGQWYSDFSQTTDEQVIECLERQASGETRTLHDEEVTIRVGHATLGGHLNVPPNATAIVIFAHGSGSSRHSTRNKFVADVLNEANIGTLLFDLLTTDEEVDRRNVFDIELLAHRLIEVTRWLREQPDMRQRTVGYFGASTGAAAALWAAAEPGSDIAAVVSRGGRPDLASARLAAVKAPTLLIVGGDDDVVLDLNRRAQKMMVCENHLAVVPGATHLFEEPGTLRHAAELARDWMLDHLSALPV